MLKKSEVFVDSTDEFGCYLSIKKAFHSLNAKLKLGTSG